MVAPDLHPETVGAALVAAGVAPQGAGRRPPVVSRLDSGYSWITLRVDWGGGDGVIVRVAPVGGTVEPYDPSGEARRLRAVVGVIPAPEVLAVCEAPNPIGRPFGVHSVVVGEAVRRPADPQPYRAALAATLGTLHSRADPRALDDVADIGSAYEVELARQGEAYRCCWRHPGIDVALRWLAGHRPACGDRPALCHGDYRPANVLWTAPGVIGGVIDWERAWVGDPLCDVAFSMHLGGWGAVEGEAAAVYTSWGGAEMDAERLSYALRFERVRSYLSGMQGLAALAAGRADDPRLVAIGSAAQAGAWDLLAWLEPGLPPLTDVIAAPPEATCPLHTSVARGSAEEDVSAVGGPPRHAGSSADPPVALALRAQAARHAPVADDDGAAWQEAWDELTERAATGGPELIEPLRALARRDTEAPGLPPMRWRDR